jgi:hypothetical protein
MGERRFTRLIERAEQQKEQIRLALLKGDEEEVEAA